jgi:hypothetical protein
MNDINIHFLIVGISIILYIIFRYYIFKTRKNKKYKNKLYLILIIASMYIIYFITLKDEKIIDMLPSIDSTI